MLGRATDDAVSESSRVFRDQRCQTRPPPREVAQRGHTSSVAAVRLSAPQAVGTLATSRFDADKLLSPSSPVKKAARPARDPLQLVSSWKLCVRAMHCARPARCMIQHNSIQYTSLRKGPPSVNIQHRRVLDSTANNTAGRGPYVLLSIDVNSLQYRRCRELW